MSQFPVLNVFESTTSCYELPTHFGKIKYFHPLTSCLYLHTLFDNEIFVSTKYKNCRKKIQNENRTCVFRKRRKRKAKETTISHWNSIFLLSYMNCYLSSRSKPDRISISRILIWAPMLRIAIKNVNAMAFLCIHSISIVVILLFFGHAIYSFWTEKTFYTIGCCHYPLSSLSPDISLFPSFPVSLPISTLIVLLFVEKCQRLILF